MFARLPAIQVIDLDAAMGRGSNTAILNDIAARSPGRAPEAACAQSNARASWSSMARTGSSSVRPRSSGWAEFRVLSSLPRCLGIDRCDGRAR